MTWNPNDPKSIALAYITACARQDLDAVAALVAPDLEFVGVAKTVHGAQPYLDVLRWLGPVWKDSAVQKVFSDGDEVAVFYDFVTDTAAGAVPCVERMRIEGGRIRKVNLYFDRVRFQPAKDEAERRAMRATG